MTADLYLDMSAYTKDCLGAVVLDADFKVLAISGAVAGLSGFDDVSLIGRPGWDLVHPDDLDRAVNAVSEAVATGGVSPEGMFRVRLADGTHHYYGIRAMTLGPENNAPILLKFDEANPRLRAEAFARDTVETLHLLAESRQLNECLESVHRLAERHVQGVVLEISTFDHDGSIHRHRRVSHQEFRTEASGPARPAPHVQAALDDHRRGPWKAFNRMAAFEETPEGCRVTAVITDDADALVGYVEATRPTTSLPDEHEWMVYGLIRQVLTVLLRRLKLDEHLRDAAERDPLTGLANRRRLLQAMTEVPASGSLVMLIDLDRFSWINNTHGHYAGDQVLVSVAKSLELACPSDAVIARLGGDEFIVWVPTQGHDPHVLSATVHAHLGELTGAESQPVACSVGAVRVRAGESSSQAIHRADQAMYVAKRSGGDGVHVA